MIPDLLVPPRLARHALDGIREVADAARRLPEIEQILESRFETLSDYLRETIKAVEALVPLLERQGETTASLRPPLDANEAATETMVRELIAVRKSIETMQPDIAVVRDGIETMHPDITAMREAIEATNHNLESLRGIFEPLGGATTRIGRFTDRHTNRSRK